MNITMKKIFFAEHMYSRNTVRRTEHTKTSANAALTTFGYCIDTETIMEGVNFAVIGGIEDYLNIGRA